MSKVTGIVLALLLLGAEAQGAPQQIADKSFQDTRIRESLVTTPAGGLTFSLQNKSPRSITAYVLLVRMPGLVSQTPRIVDSVYALHMSPVQQAQMAAANATGSYVVIRDVAAGRAPAPTEVSLLAVLFDDGSSAGDPTWVSILVERRKARLQVLRDTVNMLQAAQANNEPDRLSAGLQTKVASLGRRPDFRKPADWVRWEAQYEIYQGTVGTLETNTTAGRDPALVIQALLREYSKSIATLENSKPSLTPN